MAASRYYTLIASLPALEHFLRAERLPINRDRLEQRLANLDAFDAADLAAARRLTDWHSYPAERTDEEMVRLFAETMPDLKNPRLRAFVHFRMDVRTAIAALRRRHQQRVPSAGEVWGAGSRVRWIETHWEHPDFGLGNRFAWLSTARDLIADGDAVGMERLLMDVMWQPLCRLADRRPFAFEEVFAYVFRWDILDRWLSHDEEPARERFLALVSEALSGHEQILR